MQKSKKISQSNKKNEKKFFIYGKHTVLSALNNKQRKKFRLYISSKYIETCKSYKDIVDVQVIHKDDFQKFIPFNSVHQEIALEVLPLPELSIENVISSKKTSCIVILDQVQDPHNIGAILRSAASFDVDAVINTVHNSPSETSVMAKSASGAMDIIPYIKAMNITNVINILKNNGYWCYAMDGTGKNDLSKISLPEKLVIVLGSEESGIRKLVKENCDDIFKISMNNQIESLNVSVAGSIAMHQHYLRYKIK